MPWGGHSNTISYSKLIIKTLEILEKERKERHKASNVIPNILSQEEGRGEQLGQHMRGRFALVLNMQVEILHG